LFHPHQEYSRVIARKGSYATEFTLCDNLIWELEFSLSYEFARKKSLHNLEIRIQELTHTLASLHEKNPLLESSRFVMKGTNICNFFFGEHRLDEFFQLEELGSEIIENRELTRSDLIP
jgi:hypothetical protein